MRLLTLPAAYRPALLAQALFGERFYWPFAKDLKDLVAGSPATLRGNASLGTDGTKKGIVFPGGGTGKAGAVDLPEFQLGASWTISLWVKLNKLDDYVHLFDSIGVNNNFDPVNGINLKIAGDNAGDGNKRKFYLWVANLNRAFYSTDVIPVGEWVMITVTYTPGRLMFYANNRVIGSEAVTFQTAKSTYRMGGDMGNTQNTNGFQRDVRIWDSALSQATIQQLYSRG